MNPVGRTTPAIADEESVYKESAYQDSIYQESADGNGKGAKGAVRSISSG